MQIELRKIVSSFGNGLLVPLIIGLKRKVNQGEGDSLMEGQVFHADGMRRMECMRVTNAELLDALEDEYLSRMGKTLPSILSDIRKLAP